MKKAVKIVGAVALTASFMLSVATATACGHTHKWEWHRSETEHWQQCECGEKLNSGEHEDSVCDTCAEFRVIAFGFNKDGDSAHADFANDANKWFPEKGKELGFTYEYSNTGEKGWVDLNEEKLANYDLVMFLNDRPWGADQQEAFKNFMDNGGAWMGFHSAAFCMDSNNPHWGWYQDDFLGCGDYKNNTWNPTSEPLTVEDNHNHCATENIPDVFTSAPCEWYGWMSDLTANDDITVLLTLNPTQQNPAGDQPDPSKAHEIWYEGSHPIAWANKKYKMVYMNWGHNLQSYNNGAEGKQSSTFSSEQQNQFMLDAMFGLTK